VLRRLLKHPRRQLLDIHHHVQHIITKKKLPVTDHANHTVTILTIPTTPVSAESTVNTVTQDESRLTVHPTAPKSWLLTTTLSAAMVGLLRTLQ
jgi:hypothetical protein